MHLRYLIVLCAAAKSEHTLTVYTLGEGITRQGEVNNLDFTFLPNKEVLQLDVEVHDMFLV